MRRQSWAIRFVTCFALLVAVGLARSAQAQVLNPNGVLVDANGVLMNHTFADQTGQLEKDRIRAAKAKLSKDINKGSNLRLISLNRLDAAINKLSDKHIAPTDEMLHLAGITRVRYVFYYPETKDVVIGGPAEGWVEDFAGRGIGMESGKPTLELQDLLVALRAYPASGKQTQVIMCSIDPTQEGLAGLQSYLRNVGHTFTGAPTPEFVNQLTEGVRSSMGMHDIKVGGVPAATHFAQVLVEADYRMKLIGIGLEKTPVKMANYVDRANPAQVSSNALQRWFFVPDYHCVRVEADDQAMELEGEGVKLVGEDQVVSREGVRVVSSRSNKASQQFVEAFTKNYAKIAARVPVFAQLRNCIDLAVVAAFLQQHDWYGKSGWSGGSLLSESVVPVETFEVPKHTNSVVNAIFRGASLMTPVGGGVHIEPGQAIRSENLLQDDDGKLAKRHSAIDLSKIAADRWWWDAE
jgi:hypothetical protein